MGDFERKTKWGTIYITDNKKGGDRIEFTNKEYKELGKIVKMFDGEILSITKKEQPK